MTNQCFHQPSWATWTIAKMDVPKDKNAEIPSKKNEKAKFFFTATPNTTSADTMKMAENKNEHS